MTQSTMSAQQLLTSLPERLIAANTQAVQAIIGVSLLDGGDWQITIGNGVCSVTAEKPLAPTATMTATSDDFVRVMLGTLSPHLAIVTGKLKISGNTQTLISMERWFSL